MTVNLTNEQKVLIQAIFKTAAGNPTIVGSPVWSTSDDHVISVVPSANGFEAYAVANNAGSATVTLRANADLNGGNREISGNLACTVGEAEAMTIEFVVNPPELKV